MRLGGAESPGDPLWCVDDGIGMTLTEVQEVLSTVGRSSKRDQFDLPVGDYLGQFGIGLLSCFMVADRVTVRTRSAKGGPAVEWVGHASGVFTATEIADDLPIGTRVEFVPRPDDSALTSVAAVRYAAKDFGEYLDVPVSVNGTKLNSNPIWATTEADTDLEARRQLFEFGAELLGAPPLAAIPLSVPGTDLRGTAFVLPFPPSPNARQSHRVYLGRMLVTDNSDDLLPDWAFFVRCVITTTAAHPTASREQLVDDEALAHLRTSLGSAIRRWVERTGREHPGLLEEFVSIHHLGLRSVAIHDPALAATIVPWLPFETTAGRMQLRRFVERWPVVRYVSNATEFDAVAALARADEPILNAGYVYDQDIIHDLPRVMPGVQCVEVTASSVLDSLNAPAPAEQATAAQLERRATEALAATKCQAVVRVFNPSDCASFLVVDPDLWRRLERDQAQSTPGLWGSMVQAMSAAAPQALRESPPASRLCLNWSNPTVRKLATAADELAASRILRVLYCQAVLAAHRPLAEAERTLLATSLDDLLELTTMEAQ